MIRTIPHFLKLLQMYNTRRTQKYFYKTHLQYLFIYLFILIRMIAERSKKKKRVHSSAHSPTEVKDINT